MQTMRVKATIAAMMLTLVGAGAATGQDMLIFGGGKIELNFPSEGATQDLSIYIEAERGGVYGGVLGLVSNDQTAAKVELYAGYRAETATGFTYDLSYTRFNYPNDSGDCCGEVALYFAQQVHDTINLSTKVTYDPDVSLAGIEIGAEISATDTLTVSANYMLTQQAAGANDKSWDIGVGYDLHDDTSLDLRYYHGSDTPGYFGIALSFETNLLGG